MIDFFSGLNPIYQTLIATFITFFLTSLGSGIVFFFKNVNKKVLDGMLGLSAGIMLSASFWSLLNPALEGSINVGQTPWLVLSFGFITGVLFLILGDYIYNKIKKTKNNDFKRNFMLIFSITIHNIPEGMAIGIAFGSVYLGLPNITTLSAFMLALGIGVQNFPEGSAISLPLRRDGYSRLKSFLIGSLSGIVEPIAGLIGCILVLTVRNILPFFLSFAAGAMIYVVVSEIIPESQENGNKILVSLFTLLGFIIMMILDVALS